MLTEQQNSDAPTLDDNTPWPPEVDLILSAMEVAQSSYSLPHARATSAGNLWIAPLPGASVFAGTRADFAHQRRLAPRAQYRTRAKLKLYADPAGTPPWTLYTRDADSRGIGFITPHLLPLGYGGWVTLRAPDGGELRLECTIYRCRKTVQGWYEGALKFHREAWQLEQHPARSY